MLPSGDLSELGFIKNGIVETIVSTFDEERNPHAAPMGVTTEDLRSIILKPFKTSQTYENLLKRRSGVANITSDPAVFHRTVFKESGQDRMPEEWFTHAQTVDAPRMTNTDACIEFRVLSVEEAGEKVRMLCRVEKILVINRPILRAYSRAVPAVIESLIHATRIKVFLTSGEEEKAEELIGLVGRYRRLVERVAPNSQYSEIMQDIEHRIGEWRKVD